MSGTTRAVHQLVLEAFVGIRPAGLVACHNDGKPANNTVGNLRWDTQQSNILDKIKHGTMPIGENNNKAKLTEGEVLEIRDLYKTGSYGLKELANKFGVQKYTVTLIVHGETWKHITHGVRVSPAHYKSPVRRGSEHSRSKLSEDAVRSMRNQYANGNCTFKELGKKHGVSLQVAYCAVKGKTWKHVA